MGALWREQSVTNDKPFLLHGEGHFAVSDPGNLQGEGVGSKEAKSGPQPNKTLLRKNKYLSWTPFRDTGIELEFPHGSRSCLPPMSEAAYTWGY